MGRRSYADAGAALLLASLLHLAGGDHRRNTRDTGPISIVVTGPELPGVEDDPPLDLAELGSVPAWRDLWLNSLQQLNREPMLNDTQEDVLAPLGSTAFLHCSVKNLGERGISWVRRRDWHIISSGLLMYTNDERFQVVHTDGSDDWTLQIKYVQPRDNGTYECQVSTGRGILSRHVRLVVLVPEAFILGAEEHHVDAGSTLSLVCIIDKSPVAPQYVFWYHNARMVNYDVNRGITVETSPGPRTQSTLTVREAQPEHSGNYSCQAAGAEPATIHVYVEHNSDKMAATLSRNTASLQTASMLRRFFTMFVLCCSYVLS